MKWFYRKLAPWHKHMWVVDKQYFGDSLGEKVYKLVCVKCHVRKMWSETDIAMRDQNKPLMKEEMK